MDVAIVTGAETPLGLHLIQLLVRLGYRVHGIGNNFSKVTFADSQFFGHAVDLTDLAAVTETMSRILAEEKSLDLLVHAIDVTPGAAFEKLPVGNLEAILKIGLLGPVMLTRLALPNLLRFRGQLINVIPANKSGAPASAVNALLEGGLREMNRALFDGARDGGLRVTNLVLRQNPEPDSLSVKSSEQTHIDLEDVARAIEHLLDPNFANVPAELVLHPRTSAHADTVLPEVPMPLDPYNEVVLPPRAYCPPEQPKIPTQEKAKIDRTIPYTDDEMEDKIAAAIEDFDAHPERYEPAQRKPQQAAPQKHEKSQNNRPDDGGGEDSSKNKRRRGRRRGGRNRKRDRDPNAPSQDAQPQNQGADPKPQQDSRKQPSRSKPEPAIHSPEKSKRPARRGRSKSDSKPDSKPEAKLESKPNSTPMAKSEMKVPQAGAPKKAATKKAAKKAAKKAPAKKAVKKTVAKKAAKKKAAKKVAKKAESPKAS